MWFDWDGMARAMLFWMVLGFGGAFALGYGCRACDPIGHVRIGWTKDAGGAR
jgi:hypothetical protein